MGLSFYFKYLVSKFLEDFGWEYNFLFNSINLAL